jgi:AAA+ ATPase superfamily predicted ATPase
MRQEFREPANYNSILQAIASGAVTLGEIVSFSRLESSVVSRYLSNLQELQYVEKILPFNANSLKNRNSQYKITENFVAFWYRYIFPYRNQIESGEGELFYKVVEKDLSVYVGHIFEDITRQYLRRVNLKNQLPFLIKNFGTWWGKDSTGQVQEIDVVGESLFGKELLLGECKWKNNIKVNKVLTTLMNRTTLFPQNETYPYLFTKTPVEIPEDSPVKAISVEEFFQECL